jgi:alpha-tubulin suppressor-like RCC1 family protein
VLTVGYVAPIIVSQPTNAIGVAGSSEAFSVNVAGSLPMSFQWQFNGTNISGATNVALILANLLLANEGTYDVVITNAYGLKTSSNAYLNVVDMAEALNTTNLIWTTGGDVPWFVQANAAGVDLWGLGYGVTHDGFASMQSGNTAVGQQSILHTTIVGPATLTFWWQAVSLSNPDYLSCSVNGTEQARISGITSWQQMICYLGAGTNLLQWAYTETDSQTSAKAAGWVDQVSVTPGGTPPFITLNPVSQVVLLESNATLNAAALGTPPFSYQWQFNGTNLDGATNTSLALSNMQFANEGNYALVASNAFGAAVTTTAYLNVVDFTESLNATNLIWSSGGNQPWYPETSTTHDGVAALQSGAIIGSQQSTVQTTVNGPGTLIFWWKVSSEINNDYVNFSVDGAEQSRISGTVNWRQQTYYLTPGTHTLAWNYSKNATVNSGSDAAWLDQVSYVAGGTAAFITVNPTDQVAMLGSNAAFTVTAQGTPPINCQWLFNSNNIPSATNSTLTITNVQITNSGSYQVVVANDYGSATSTNANLFLLNVVAWGAGKTNTITSPNYGQSIVPTNLSGIAIAGGGYHSLALRSNGRVTAWGYNSYGETNVPTTLTNATALAAGLYHSLALRSNGTVSAWGYSGYSQTTVPASATNVSAIAAGWYHSLALRSNGTVVAWGAGTFQSSSPYFGQSMVPTNLTGVTAVAAGGYHSLALRTNGTVVAWGWNAFGQTNVPVGLSNVVAIAAGGSNSIALKNDGTLVAWGANSYGQTNIPVGLSNVVAISAGATHDMALKNDGTLVVWGLNGNGQTNVPAGLTNIAAISAGGYHSLARVNVGPVTFLGPPYNQTIYKGSNVTFTAPVLGAAPLSYQWFQNGTNVVNGTNASLVITNAQLTDAGNYQLVVGNSYGAVSSAVAVLTVNDTSPFFTLQLTNQFVLANSNVLFAISVGGMPPLSYQWQFNGTNLVGKTNTTLLITNAQLTNEGYYSVAASNAFGVTTSSNAFLNVIDLAEALDATNLVWITSTNPPWFPETNVTHDGFAAASSGPMVYPQQTTLQTTVVGPGTLNFWWMDTGFGGTTYFNFSINGTNQATLSPVGWQQKTFYLAAGTNVLQWTFFKSDTACCTTFAGYVDQVAFTPGGSPPIVVTPPSDKTVPAGTNVTFVMVAGGTPPLSYQWQFSGTNIMGATGASLTLNNVQATNAGSYSVVVSNTYGVTNASAVLTINPSAPFLLSQPSNQEMVRGGAVTFTVSARGSDPLSYQWQFNHADIPDATNSSLTLSNIQTNNVGSYCVIVNNAYGTIASSNATLVIVPTVIVGWGSVFTSSPNPPLGLTNVTAISAGDNFSVALKSDSTVYAWGWDAFSRLNVPAGLTNVSVISAGGFHGSALVNDGTVVDWGDSFFDASVNVPAGLSNVVDVAAGYRFNLGLKRDGTVAAWGDNFLNPLNLPPGLSNIVDIGAGWYHGLALEKDGTVVAWGYNSSGQTNVPPGLTNVVAIAAGWFHSMALKDDGSVVVWGGNSSGQTNIPPSLTNVVAIAAGAQHCLALKNDGTVIAWGSNSSGQTNVPSWLTNVVAIAGGSFHSLALLNDGSPFITKPLLSRTTSAGSAITLNASVMGSQPLNYQWQFNGTNLAGATNAMLTLTNLPVTVAGSYRCLVSNALGSVITSNAALTVTRQPLRFDVSPNSPQITNGSLHLRLLNLAGAGPVLIEASSDLITWKPVYVSGPVVGTLEFLDADAANHPQRFYRATEGAAISITPLRFDVSAMTNGGFNLGLSGLTGHGNIVIHASSNLVNWEPILTNPPVVGSLQFLDTGVTNQPYRFYRAIEQ